MGKIEEEQSLSTLPVAEIPQESVGNGCRIRRFVRFRCVAALVLGAAVLLSAIFWLPPFLRGDRGDPDSEATVVASFKLHKPVPLLKENIGMLEIDIYEELQVLNSLVLVTSLEPLAGSNWTIVTFGVWPRAKNSTIPSASISVLRGDFVSLVIQQSILHLTPSLFGDPSSFQVLKFPGGITVIPQQSGFPLQRAQVGFNFTLNFSIYQIEEVFGELKSQLELGLHLTSLENLYIRLTNVQGSTLAPPIIVQSSILLAVGTPESSRMKQLAQTIRNSTARNLGLNHTVFGKVKQIQLSSIVPHSNSSNSSSTPGSPSPAPVPHANHRHHHHHHHHHHHRHRDAHLTPMPAPTPAPSPQHSAQPSSRSGCRYRISRKRAHSGPIAAPVVSPHPPVAPHLHGDPPAPHSLPLRRPTPPASSPLPSVFFARAQPPSKSASLTALPDGKLPVSLPPSSFDGGLPTVDWFQWACSLLLCLVIFVRV